MGRFFSAIFVSLAVLSVCAVPGSAARLDEALRAVRDDDWATAQRLARGDGEVAGTIVEWHRLRAGEGAFSDYRSFLQRHPDWPGLELLRRRGEDTIPAGADPRDVLDYFLQTQPQTGTGAMRLAAAFKALGETAAANAAALDELRVDGGTFGVALSSRGIAVENDETSAANAAALDELRDDGGTFS